MFSSNSLTKKGPLCGVLSFIWLGWNWHICARGGRRLIGFLDTMEASRERTRAAVAMEESKLNSNTTAATAENLVSDDSAERKK